MLSSVNPTNSSINASINELNFLRTAMSFFQTMYIAYVLYFKYLDGREENFRNYNIYMHSQTSFTKSDLL